MFVQLANLGLLSTVVLVASGLAQAPPALPARVDPPRGAIVPNTPARIERDLERRMRDLRTLESRTRVQDRIDRRVVAPPKYSSKQISEIKEKRKVGDQFLNEYSAFLRSKGTGIFRLFPDDGCFSTSVISVEERCKDSVPASSGFSFRNRGYSDELYHDIYYKGRTLGSHAFFSQGIFVSLGSVTLETVGLDHEAVVSITSLVADSTPEGAINNAERYRQGWAAGKFRFADRVSLEPGGTYLVRNICYQSSNSFPQIDESTTMTELKFLSLSLDKRSDAVVVFKVLEIDANGGVTLVWRMLSSQDAPKLKFPKGRLPRDLREVERDN